jgi:hypothetical protein
MSMEVCLETSGTRTDARIGLSLLKGEGENQNQCVGWCHSTTSLLQRTKTNFLGVVVVQGSGSDVTLTPGILWCITPHYGRVGVYEALF